MWGLLGDGTRSQLDFVELGAQLKAGMGPRVLPSQAGQPIAHPLENQKQACPFAPVRLRPGSEAAAVSLGIGHHGSNGTFGPGTLPPHGISLESMAFLEGGYVMAPCPATATAALISSAARITRDGGRCCSLRFPRLFVDWVRCGGAVTARRDR